MSFFVASSSYNKIKFLIKALEKKNPIGFPYQIKEKFDLYTDLFSLKKK